MRLEPTLPPPVGLNRPAPRPPIAAELRRAGSRGLALGALALAALLAVALATWSASDPSLNHATDGPVRNALGRPGAAVADLLMQLLGLAAVVPVLGLVVLARRAWSGGPLGAWSLRVGLALMALGAAAGLAALMPRASGWPLPMGLGGWLGDALTGTILGILGRTGPAIAATAATFALVGLLAGHMALFAPAAGDDDAPEPAPPPKPTSTADDGDDQRDADPPRVWLALGGAALAAGTAVRRLGRLLARRPAPTAAPRATVDPPFTGRPAGPRPAPTMGPAAAPVAPRMQEGPPAAEPPAPPPRAPNSRVVMPQPETADTTLAPAPRAREPQGYAAAVEALRSAARRRLGLDTPGPTEAPRVGVPPPTPPQEPDGRRVAIEALQEAARRRVRERERPADRREPTLPLPAAFAAADHPLAAPPLPNSLDRSLADDDDGTLTLAASPRVAPRAPAPRPGRRESREAQPDLLAGGAYELPPIALLQEAKRNGTVTISEDALEQNARLLEGVLEDFGVRGEIIQVRPGPVVTLYELEPAPGTKSSRVIGLAEDIARSMSAVACRVAVVPGRNAIGIELPNQRRETVYLREIVASQDFERSALKLALALGKTIGGEPVITELAKMPHLLVAGTTGSGKSVAINTMILSLLYRLTPEQCRLIMIDPKMLELSVYDGIPHLLTPVVTDPKKAVVALKWAVREMEDRYRKMSRLGVRNIDGFNQRVAEARTSGVLPPGVEELDRDSRAVEELLRPLPYIIVIIDEMADLMMVAGKDIEGAVQRLAQMARAAGIHVIMATQRPSVDVITGTIKANFPTRISFQVTSKIDSRTILGEQGAEQLLGQGDMLFMAGGGRISRVHGPFVSDAEVERVVAHLKRQGTPQYLDITREEEEGEERADGAVFDEGAFGEESGDLYEQAVRIVLRDRKASTSYIQRRLQIGYNRAASLMERMEREGVVGPANHAGKREILVEGEMENA